VPIPISIKESGKYNNRGSVHPEKLKIIKEAQKGKINNSVFELMCLKERITKYNNGAGKNISAADTVSLWKRLFPERTQNMVETRNG